MRRKNWTCRFSKHFTMFRNGQSLFQQIYLMQTVIFYWILKTIYMKIFPKNSVFWMWFWTWGQVVPQWCKFDHHYPLQIQWGCSPVWRPPVQKKLVLAQAEPSQRLWKYVKIKLHVGIYCLYLSRATSIHRIYYLHTDYSRMQCKATECATPLARAVGLASTLPKAVLNY